MPKSQAALDVARVAPDTLLRLATAAQLAFPDGSIGLSSLKREAARGRLTIWRVANKDMTTLAEIRSMVDRCRVESCQPVSGCARPPRKNLRQAQAAVKMRIQRLKGSRTGRLHAP